MDKFIDAHCHIIPGVDDGAKNTEDTANMLKIAYDEGIRCIVATPHHHPKRGMSDLDLLRQQIKIAREEAAKIDKEFRVYLGMEVLFSHDIPGKIKDNKICGINNKPVMLVEFSPGDKFHYILNGVKLVQSQGMDVIMAHCERYKCLVDNMEYVDHLVEMGVKLQINAGSIGNKSGRRIGKFTYNLMENDYVFCVGTDAHNTDTRAPHIKEAAEYVSKNFGRAYMKKIFFDNMAEILKKRIKEENIK